MRIGVLARVTGILARTIRFYEAEGLLAEPRRTEGDYRDYDAAAVERLVFIKKARLLGLSLKEVGSVLQLHERQEPTCVHVRALLDDKLSQVERAIQELLAFREELVRLKARAGTLEDCCPTGGSVCGIIEGWETVRVVTAGGLHE
ncbi:MAG: heavy metal-responsive transcriptional regulator [Chloroflexi bacterium]|nr:heavy metal-responsive transcriptional regulator [Chloroflexota bacterium]